MPGRFVFWGFGYLLRASEGRCATSSRTGLPRIAERVRGECQRSALNEGGALRERAV